MHTSRQTRSVPDAQTLDRPLQTTLSEYMADIGLTYVMIPVITAGIGLVRAQGAVDTSGGGSSRSPTRT